MAVAYLGLPTQEGPQVCPDPACLEMLVATPRLEQAARLEGGVLTDLVDETEQAFVGLARRVKVVLMQLHVGVVCAAVKEARLDGAQAKSELVDKHVAHKLGKPREAERWPGNFFRSFQSVLRVLPLRASACTHSAGGRTMTLSFWGAWKYAHTASRTAVGWPRLTALKSNSLPVIVCALGV